MSVSSKVGKKVYKTLTEVFADHPNIGTDEAMDIWKMSNKGDTPSALTKTLSDEGKQTKSFAEKNMTEPGGQKRKPELKVDAAEDDELPKKFLQDMEGVPPTSDKVRVPVKTLDKIASRPEYAGMIENFKKSEQLSRDPSNLEVVVPLMEQKLPKGTFKPEDALAVATGDVTKAVTPEIQTAVLLNSPSLKDTLDTVNMIKGLPQDLQREAATAARMGDPEKALEVFAKARTRIQGVVPQQKAQVDALFYKAQANNKAVGEGTLKILSIDPKRLEALPPSLKTGILTPKKIADLKNLAESPGVTPEAQAAASEMLTAINNKSGALKKAGYIGGGTLALLTAVSAGKETEAQAASQEGEEGQPQDSTEVSDIQAELDKDKEIE
jgi:hypothetical protein